MSKKIQKRAVRTIWKNDLMMHKKKNFIIIGAISLTTLLFTIVICIGQSFVESNNKQSVQLSGTVADGAISNLKVDQYKLLQKTKSIDKIGQQRTLAYINPKSLKIKNNLAMLHWYDQEEWKNLKQPAITSFEGKYPKRENEIIASEFSLKILGIDSPKIGMKIPISFEIGDKKIDKKFVLTGFYKDFLSKRIPDISYFIVSDSFNKKFVRKDHSTITSYTFKNKKNLSKKNKELRKLLNLSDTQEFQSSNGVSKQSQFSVLFGTILFSLIILISGGLLIYNVIYISLAEDIHFYGLLKTIGTTRGQIKRIVRIQTFVLAGIGIPIGLLTGIIISFLIIPVILNKTNFSDAVVVSTNPLIYLVAIILAFIMTSFSSYRSANLASKISAIQALIFSEKRNSNHEKKSINGSNIFLFAWRNLFREKKRAIVVILSLFLSITTFTTVNTILKSIDFESFLVEKMSYDANIEVFDKDNSRKKRQINNENGEQLLKSIRDQKAISDYHEYFHEFVHIPYETEKYDNYFDSYNQYFKYGKINKSKISNDNFIGELVSIDSEEAEKLASNTNRKFDKKAFERGEMFLIQSDCPEDFKKFGSIKISKDRKIYYEGKIGGYIPNKQFEIQTSSGPVIFVSKEFLFRVSPDAELLSCNFNIEKKNEQTLINNLTTQLEKQSSYIMSTKSGMRERARNETAVLSFLGNTLSIVLLAIGVFNFINLISTSILTRKREFATLESIGMTHRQLSLLLTLEGFYYALLVALLTSTFGTLITYTFFKIVKKTATYAVFTVPKFQIMLVVLLVILICLIIPNIVFTSLRTKDLSVRIRE